MRVLITVSEGPHQGQVFRFEGHDVFLVGRSKKAHFRLPAKDEYFSRLHFLVEVNPPHCRLTDLGSANGTFVNGQRVAAADLNDGDRIQAGQTVMQVRIEKQEEASSLPTPEVMPHVMPSSVSPVNLSAFKEQVFSKSGPPVPCVVCASPAPSVASHNDPDKTVAMSWPLCWTCRERCSTIPQPFPDYLFLRQLGQGGMGVVHLALHVPQGRLVAVKSIASARESNAVEVQRFLREARILQQLQHPHIVAFHEMADFGGAFYFSMDFVEGEDCAALVKQRGPMSMARAVNLVAQTLEALDYAHQRGIVHRDIKPANLQVTSVEGLDVVKVLDFGLARAYQMSRLGGLTLKGEMGGTVPFMAPEQITNFRESQPAVDQYAAAATLYYLLTGHFIHDFPVNFHERLLMILEKPPVPLRERLPQAPPSLADAIHRALAYESTSRFRDVAAFRAALLAVPP